MMTLAESARRTLVLAVATLLISAQIRGAEPHVVEAQWVHSVGTGGRSALAMDPLQSMIVRGTWTGAKAGDVLALGDKSETWADMKANSDGVYTVDARGSVTMRFVFESEKSQVAIFSAAGFRILYVNGEPRFGDPYAAGMCEIPVALKAGRNEFLLTGVRMAQKPSLKIPPARAFLTDDDPTFPTMFPGESLDSIGGVVVTNATTKEARGLVIETHVEGGTTTRTVVPTILPTTRRKVPFTIKAEGSEEIEDRVMTLRLFENGHAKEPLSELVTELTVNSEDKPQDVTFLSRIDGSVQYYAVMRASEPGAGKGLVLSLHGAAVEGRGQAAAYAPKRWCHIVSPTNRRPFGFDWEDWGHDDAMEVLELARVRYQTNPSHTWLTGHSMGGHGTWSIGVQHPDLFAAIAPSAGWQSFATYSASAVAGESKLHELFRRANSHSDIAPLIRNLTTMGVYILHGDADDNVPVTEARGMKALLEQFHPGFGYHEEPGAAHWWDNEDTPGAECVDWPPMFELFRSRSIPRLTDVTSVDFHTSNLAISSRMYWAEILAQEIPGRVSRVNCEFKPTDGSYRITTEDVTRFAIEPHPRAQGGTFTFAIDDSAPFTMERPTAGDRFFVERKNRGWVAAAEPSPKMKYPARNGPFKRAFDNHMVFVYGTRGNAKEDAWALAKARFDAAQFYVIGNGSIDVMTDREFLKANRKDRSMHDRNVILYGNADTNAAWGTVLSKSPIHVTRRAVKFAGGPTFQGDDLGCLFVAPRAGSDTASVGVVTGTGLVGSRVTDRMNYFTSGAGFPDYLVLGAETLAVGEKGVRIAGFFGDDWNYESERAVAP